MKFSLSFGVAAWAALMSMSTLVFAAGGGAGGPSVPVTVQEDGVEYQGKLFLPHSAQKPVPLVIVVHEWWGKTEYPEMRAKRIADELGYGALAVDLFGNGKTVSNPKEAQAATGPFYKNPAQGVKLLNAFIAAAPDAAQKAGKTLDLSRIGAIGYCFGGTQVLNLARSGSLPPGDVLKGVVSFHGGLASTLKPNATIPTKILVLHGAADKMVSESDVEAFKKEMQSAHADLEFVAYPGALHAFTNPKATELGKKFQIPIAYNKEADLESWMKMKQFFKKIF